MYSEDGTCDSCGKPLPERRRRDMRTCSAECRKTLARRASTDDEPRVCHQCGGPIAGNQRKYCGPSCGREAAYVREHGPRIDRSTPIPCARCGTDIVPKADGPLPTYCGGACRAGVGYERAREDGRYDAWLVARRNAYVPVKRVLVCQRPECGQPFESKRSGAKWCTDRCAMRAYNARREEDGRLARYRAERRQREADQSVPSEVFRSADVYERDAWVCSLCSGPIDSALRWPEPGSASVDHVVPLSKGGAHALSNVKAAHLQCNQRKNNRLITAT